MTSKAHTLCRVDDIPDPGARGFDFETPDGPFGIIVVRRGGKVYVYVNECPHQGTPLETFPDRFLSRDGGELICSTHGARFRIEDGHCTDGPCIGARLKVAPFRIADGSVILGMTKDGFHSNTKV